MLFTVTIDLPGSAYFEFSTESLFEMAEIAQMLGNTDVVEEDDEEIDIPDEIANYFTEGEEYEYDEDADCWCWYDEEHEAWYWLDEDTGEWLLVEDADGYEVEQDEKQESE
jgi:hypothetical protein